MDIQISPEFKKQTSRAIFAIGLFIIVYILLILIGFLITIACIGGGIALIVAKPMFFTLALGIGLASLGVMIIIFLLKFLFKRNKTDLSNFTEVKRSEEPKLFAFIDEIVAKTKTNFPKKVFLSTEVNASVFYDSSFWSMFLPIRKNLHIGMGLVNSVTHDELKAILAHEFGHFSQRTMKVGSFVYNVNQIIYNMLYDNDSYRNLIQKWANVSGYFSIFVAAAVKIIQGIQWILQKMYSIVNKSYMALSREMEFHADEVAANVTGYMPLKTSLLRMDLADKSYNSVLQFYENKYNEGWISENIFKEHAFIMNFYAKKQGIPITNKLPEVKQENTNSFNTSKLVIKNQWASHPETEERIAALEKIGIVKSNSNMEPASTIFNNAEETEKKLTQKLFSRVTYPTENIKINFENFTKEFETDYERESFNSIFKGYYNQYSPTKFTIEKVETSTVPFENLYNDEIVTIPSELATAQQDVMILENIKLGHYDINTFDYEGIKYNKSDADNVIKKIETEIKNLEEKLMIHDQIIYNYFHTLAAQKNKTYEFESASKKYLDFDKKFDENFELNNKISNALEFINKETPFEIIRDLFESFRPLENKLKEELKNLIELPIYKNELNSELSKEINDFNNKQLGYFVGKEYKNDQLQELFKMINTFQFLNQRIFFLHKKEWLDFKLQLLS
ncbi:MAG: M48 family metallopeptidase [Flavobacterium sp.]|uniref:M48 family metallopeptidase n=1 Tax=Flavobacterium sp. TaxID=239 RepID=UPI0025B7F218|nr:M48 family metallopeptidase [Flavobacterium sp.]MCA1966679.1 M48 family metallopeptidase [Flavobacterium sp.]